MLADSTSEINQITSNTITVPLVEEEEVEETTKPLRHSDNIPLIFPQGLIVCP